MKGSMPDIAPSHQLAEGSKAKLIWVKWQMVMRLYTDEYGLQALSQLVAGCSIGHRVFIPQVKFTPVTLLNRKNGWADCVGIVQALRCVGGSLQEAVLPVCSGGRRLGPQRRQLHHLLWPQGGPAHLCAAQEHQQGGLCHAVPQACNEVG